MTHAANPEQLLEKLATDLEAFFLPKHHPLSVQQGELSGRSQNKQGLLQALSQLQHLQTEHW